MNNAAKELARGNYDADFSGKGYREINELAITLNYASKELAKTDKLQRELISNISHDLRTPLTMIKGYSEVMRDIPDENTPENIQVIIDETTRLSELVNDMLDLSKIQSGARKPDFEEFSITDTVKDTLVRYEKLIKQGGYRIEFDADRDAIVVADRGMILQVVYNLINNAINYTGSDKYVMVTQTCTEAGVRISVTDTGEGISPEDIGQIWERYYRVDKVHKRETIGTGLGLSIVKGVLEIHNANFGVDSREGEGSTFWFELQLSNIPDIINAEYDNTDDEEL
jgi:signal transduction histidine kinase